MRGDYISVTEGDRGIGTGHVMRQISLANAAIKRGVQPLLISHSSLAQELCSSNDIPVMKVDSSAEVIDAVKSFNWSNLIIDVHESNFDMYRTSCKKNTILMVSEVGYNFLPFGNHIIRIGSDLQKWNLIERVTSTEKDIIIYSGRAWMIFRDEFNTRINESQHESNTILICHGGSDRFGLTQRCIKALEWTRKHYTCNILVTRFFSDLDTITSLARDSKHRCEVIADTDSPEFWMRRSKVALINGGNVRYELCVTQTPFVAISFQPQQYKCTEQISTLGTGINLGVMDAVSDKDIADAAEYLLTDDDQWQTMHKTMGSLFDLNGCNRILNLLVE